MYTGEADHSLTAELVELVDVPVIASGDIISRAQSPDRPGDDGGGGGHGRPRGAGESLGAAPDHGRRRRAEPRGGRGELILFIRETTRELGERRATGFLKKFYGWYLGRGRFPRPFKQELVQLDSLAAVEQRLLAAAPGARFVLERLEDELPQGDEVLLDLPISIYGGG